MGTGTPTLVVSSSFSQLRVLSPFSSSSLGHIMWVGVVAALVLLATVDARPKDDETDAFQDVYQPDKNTVQDSWRAFEPMGASSTLWWEEPLDDNLWDAKQYPEPGRASFPEPKAPSQPSHPQQLVSEDAQDVSTDPEKDQQDPHKEDQSSEAAEQSTQQGSSSEELPKDTDSSEEVPAAPDKDADEDLQDSDESVARDEIEESWSPVYRPGKINSFVETESDPFYSAGLDDYSDKDWDDGMMMASEILPEDKAVEDDETDNQDDSDENETEDDIKDVEEAELDSSEDEEEGENEDESKETKAAQKSDVADISKAVLEMSQKVLEKSKELATKADQKEDQNVNSSSDKKEPMEPMGDSEEAIHDQDEEEDLTDNGSDSASDGMEDKPVGGDSLKEEEEEEEEEEPFKDWDDWDNAPFEEYDEDEEDDIDEDNEEKKAHNDGELEDKKTKANEDKDFEDYYNDWEYSEYDLPNKDANKEKENKDASKSKEYSDDQNTVFTPTKKEHAMNKVEDSPMDMTLDDMDYQSDQPSVPDDDSHYSHGVIYDSYYPHHKSKPSVKKDLGNPANSDNNIAQPPPSAEISKEDVNTKIHQEKYDGKNEPQSPAAVEIPSKSVTHLGLNRLNTEADVSTSPNPPTTWAMPATSSTPATTSLPVTTTEENDLWAESDWDFDDADSQLLSYPIEFCKIDGECRAGRECVRGVCRCFKASVCEGHGKAVCGTNGIKYPSHCELHRTACVTRKHIRVDNRGKCFKKEIIAQERSWLKEQEAKAQELANQAQKAKHHDEAYQFPKDVNNDPLTSDTKKDLNHPTSKTSPKVAKEECTWDEMATFKEALLMYHCEKFVEPKCSMEVKTDRKYLSMLMFSYYDHNFDFQLTADELDDRERDEHFTKNIIRNCHLHDFVRYADTADGDAKLTVTEFTDAFEPAAPTQSASPAQPEVPVVDTLATAGNGLELKCGLDTDHMVWLRHGVQLEDDTHNHQIMVFDHGALFFSKVGLHHIGNYTCMDTQDNTNKQVHKLRVQTVPVVHVTPVTQTNIPGSDVDLRCHADGVPKPEISWRQGDSVVHNGGHFTIYYGHEHIVVHNAQVEEDAGTYTCSAHNQAGTTDKSVSVSVLKPQEPTYLASARDMGTFLVFHSKGITAYDPVSCLNKREIHGNYGDFKYIPDALDGPLKLCADGHDCQWGASVAIKESHFVYVTQPDQNRVLLMGTGETWNPLQVIDTDSRPEKLWYVQHLDQIWVLCTNNKGRGEGGKIIMVIRDASEHIQHRAVHMRPVDNHFDLVEDVFIAPANDLEHPFDFGYVSHVGQSSLHKLDLQEMAYTKTIDLTNYGCVPQAVAFIPIGGQVIVECVSASDQHTLQLTMDYMTDAIVSTITLAGQPHVSPDSRHLVTVDEFTGKVTVNSVSDEGVLARTYEVTVSASISDTSFMPTNDQHGYILLLSSADDSGIVTMNLVTGEVNKLPGTQSPERFQPWHPSPVHRHIVSGTPMSNYFMVPSRSSLAIVNSRFREVDCEYLDSTGSDVMIYIPSNKTS